MTAHERVAPVVEDAYDVVMVLTTARQHGQGPQRLPDRTDRGTRVAAVQVESGEDAAVLFSTLDREGRTFYVDVERKRDLDLVSTARSIVTRGTIRTIKPNDTTVDAFEAVVTHHCGQFLDGVDIALVGSGNLAFKFALRMAERGARVSLHGRDQAKVQQLVRTLNLVLPEFTPHAVTTEVRKSGARVLAAVVNAEHVVGPDWIARLAPHAVCLDVGINNLTPAFIEAAHTDGHTCVRLDVRSAGDPLPAEPNPFFDVVAGRRDIGGVVIVAGGQIGRLGDVVVDQVKSPTRVVGIANGTGGLLARKHWDGDQARAFASVRQRIRRGTG